MTKEEILKQILSRSSAEKNELILNSTKSQISIYPSWSAARKHRKFLKRMDTTFFNIERLGAVIESTDTDLRLSPKTQDHNPIYMNKNSIPPHDKVKEISKLFGGTVKAEEKRKLKLEKSEKKKQKKF